MGERIKQSFIYTYRVLCTFMAQPAIFFETPALLDAVLQFLETVCQLYTIDVNLKTLGNIS